jgi:hypothetical protein
VTRSPSPLDDHELVCPHCHKPFSGALIEGRAARYEGFKCPHCKLFAPLHRVGEYDAAPQVRALTSPPPSG